MRLKPLQIAIAFAALSPLALAGAAPKGWTVTGPNDDRVQIHRTTGLSCPTELLPEMGLKNFGAAKTTAPGKPFCEYERSGDVVRVYVLGKSSADPNAIKVLAATNEKGSPLAQQAYPVFQTINVTAKDGGASWMGIAFDLSKGRSQTPKVASISFASVNGWDVRLDIDYTVTNWKDPGPKSQEPELRAAMTYLLVETLRKRK